MKQPIKEYTFLDLNERIIVQVRAQNHDQAVAKCGYLQGIDQVTWSTDFYSETLED